MNRVIRFGVMLALIVAATHAAAQPKAAQPGAGAAAGAGGTRNPNSAQSYAIRMPVTLAADAPLQRLALPAEVLVRLQSPGYADIRLFNAQGQPVAIGRASAPAQTNTEERQQRFAAYPILGPVSAAGSAAGLEGLSLRIEERQGRRVVQLSAPAVTAGNAAAAPAGSAAAAQKVLGALLDVRSLDLPAVRMSLDADLPAGQPVTFRVQASKDLQSWRALADTVLYRAEAGAGGSAGGSAGAEASPGPAVGTAAGTSLGSESIDLAHTDLAGHYLRVTWGEAAVTLRAATLTTSRSSSSRERLTAAIPPSALSSPHELSFALPFGTPVAALRITPQGGNALIPVRVLGRIDRSQPWARLASTVVYRLAGAGKEQVNGPIELPVSTVREIRIEADTKTPGFTAAPDIALMFDPVQIVFVASGAGPFTLAAGLENAANAYLPMSSLIPAYQSAQENALPLAQAHPARAEVSAGTVNPGPVIAAPLKNEGLPTRTLVLWGILAAGVIALGLMAWVLLKQTRKLPGTGE